ncbi:hypothetical protein E2C01_009312 [Portunus trituberculatus]|uniref:Uncharacterized protein n=1 Tax=Portunus trituberculatus TaxID=210409 RepID=A0A5B7D5G3_PORTR|nr:hypothetical protein [Portunus trituberculatus]
MSSVWTRTASENTTVLVKRARSVGSPGERNGNTSTLYGWQEPTEAPPPVNPPTEVRPVPLTCSFSPPMRSPPLTTYRHLATTSLRRKLLRAPALENQKGDSLPPHCREPAQLSRRFAAAVPLLPSRDHRGVKVKVAAAVLVVVVVVAAGLGEHCPSCQATLSPARRPALRILAAQEKLELSVTVSEHERMING